MNKPVFVAKFSALSKTGCWHFSSDPQDNLTISWLEREKVMGDEDKKVIDKLVELVQRLGSHICDAVEIAIKAKEIALILGVLDPEDKGKLADAVSELVKKLEGCLDNSKPV